ncbi:MAG: hypothetical protein ACYTAF_02670 [Planctomycetota bacterium]|jgi:Na+-transporting methylmalonyl-CoA/oxaloacetate decarboxylase gamma subunit
MMAYSLIEILIVLLLLVLVVLAVVFLVRRSRRPRPAKEPAARETKACPKEECGFENRAKAKFCARCGADL